MKIMKRGRDAIDMLTGDDVKKFINLGEFSSLELLSRGKSGAYYKFFGVENKDLGINADKTVLAIADNLSIAGVEKLQKLTLSLSKRGVNVVPVIEYARVKENETAGEFLDKNTLFKMGIIQPQIMGTSIFAETLEDTIRKFEFLKKMHQRSIEKSFEDIIEIASSGFEVDTENPKNMIANSKGIHFLKIDERQRGKMRGFRYLPEILIKIFKQVVGTEAFPDKISSTEPTFEYFFNIDRIQDEKLKMRYAENQTAVFDKFSRGLLDVVGRRLGGDERDYVEANLKSLELNFIDAERDLIGDERFD